MAALDFPDTPSVGELYGSAGTVWRWDGARWASTAGVAGARGVVALAQITASIGGLTSILTDIAGLSVTFTARPERVYRTTLHLGCWSNVGSDSLVGFIGTPTKLLVGATVYQGIGTQGRFIMCERIETGLSGSITRKGVFQVSGSGTATIGASVDGPGFIVVEDITYEAGAMVGGGAVGTGLEAAKPIAPNPGSRYFATDTKRDWLYDGTGWIVMAEPDQPYSPIGGDINTVGLTQGFFRRSNGYCDFRIAANFAAGFVIYANPRYSLPRQANASGPGMFGATVDADYFIAGYGNIEGLAMLHIADYVTLFYRIYTGVPGLGTAISPTMPTTWTVGSAIYIQGRYPMVSRYV